MEILDLLRWPALACLVITGIHAYLGLHVVMRGVIFVDLSLAQIAALGTTVALLAGFDVHGRAAYVFSLGFTLIGAALFALSRSHKTRVPQEAFIGIVYAVSAAASIVIMDRLPEGGEHIKHLLVGNLLAVSGADVLKLAGLYAVMGALHWIWRKPFMAISTDAQETQRRGYPVRLWDFAFYATFGFVVSSSVAIAGVLLVFSFLIVPAVAAMLSSNRFKTRLAVAWSISAAVSLLGLAASSWFDTPTGATIICVFGTVLAFMALARRLLPAGRSGDAV